jgi:ATP synthase subunit 6
MFDPLEQFNIICAFKVRYCTFSSALLDNVSIVGFLNMVLLIVLLYFFSAFKAKGEISFKYFLVTIVTELNSVLKSNMFFQKQIFLGYLIILFSFILVSNVFGMIPYNVTVSSYFVLSFFFSAITFIGVTLVGIRYNRLRFLKVLLPAGVPHGMWALLIFIEMISYVSRVLSLSTRLFANMMSGHTLLKILLGFA